MRSRRLRGPPGVASGNGVPPCLCALSRRGRPRPLSPPWSGTCFPGDLCAFSSLGGRARVPLALSAAPGTSWGSPLSSRRFRGPARFSPALAHSRGAGGLGRLLLHGWVTLVSLFVLLHPPPNYYYSLRGDLPAGFVQVKRQIATKRRMRWWRPRGLLPSYLFRSLWYCRTQDLGSTKTPSATPGSIQSQSSSCYYQAHANPRRPASPGICKSN